MGKKTFEEIGKILLVSFISIIISVQATRRVLLDGKLDKQEFVDYKAEHDKKHEQEQKEREYVRQRLDDIYDHLLNKKNN